MCPVVLGRFFRKDRPDKTVQIPLERPKETSYEKERMMTESVAKPGGKGASRASKPRTARALGESATASKIRFSATLFRPVATAKAVTWTFLTLPKEASAKLPSRGMTSVEGAFNGLAFRATLEPDGQGGHWLKVDRKLRAAAGVEAGDVVALEIAPVAEEPEPRVPADLRKALAAAHPKARAVWSDITPVARRDWIQWIQSAKREETRLKRIENGCDMLAKGKRRPCCFDRSGMYSKSLNCPVADETSSDTK
jgi:hypothetical protein